MGLIFSPGLNLTLEGSFCWTDSTAQADNKLHDEAELRDLNFILRPKRRFREMWRSLLFFFPPHKTCSWTSWFNVVSSVSVSHTCFIHELKERLDQHSAPPPHFPPQLSAGEEVGLKIASSFSEMRFVLILISIAGLFASE